LNCQKTFGILLIFVAHAQQSCRNKLHAIIPKYEKYFTIVSKRFTIFVLIFFDNFFYVNLVQELELQSNSFSKNGKF
jgi:hypothetical protein